MLALASENSPTCLDKLRTRFEFLSQNEGELRRLADFQGVEGLELDFAIQDRDVPVQRDSFPASLLRLMGERNIALVITLYPTPS